MVNSFIRVVLGPEVEGLVEDQRVGVEGIQ